MQILIFSCSGVQEERELCRRGPDVLCYNVEYCLAFSTYNWSQFLSISTNEISADFRSMSGDVHWQGGDPWGTQKSGASFD